MVATKAMVNPDDTSAVFQVVKMPCSSVIVVRLDFVIDCTAKPGKTANVAISYLQVGSGPILTLTADDDSTVTFTNIAAVLSCDDANPCTTDIASGPCVCTRTCSHTAMVCNDNNVCTTDSCSNGKCVTSPISCDDGIACTADSCDAKTGCRHTVSSCCDNDACTIDSCDSKTGCQYQAIDCDDNNACTTKHVIL